MKVDLQSPVDLVVSTPGTLLQFCEKGTEPSEFLRKFIMPRFDLLMLFFCAYMYTITQKNGNI